MMTKVNRSMKSKIFLLIKIIVTGMLSIVILANCWLVFSKYILNEELPSVFGVKTAVVLSGSMDPTFSAGDILIYYEEDEYEVEDIVIFNSGGAMVTHRIIDTEGDYFITKGDANDTQDKELLDPRQIEGEMILIIPNMGTVVSFLTTPLGMLILVFLGIGIFEVPKFFDKE